MGTKEDFNNKCFSPNWLEVDLSRPMELNELSDIEVVETCVSQASGSINKEARLESERRKDLNTLLKELEEIKSNIEKAAEKQHRLANLMGFYTGELAQ